MSIRSSTSRRRGGGPATRDQSGAAVRSRLRFDLVDLGSEESFPASDPPAWMGSTSTASGGHAKAVNGRSLVSGRHLVP